MKVGVPKEVKNHEYRVALTPIGVHELTQHGHDVYVEKGAGAGSQIPDEEYVASGATLLDGADDVWGTADMVLKVKEPVAEEYARMREVQVGEERLPLTHARILLGDGLLDLEHHVGGAPDVVGAV